MILRQINKLFPNKTGRNTGKEILSFPIFNIQVRNSFQMLDIRSNHRIVILQSSHSNQNIKIINTLAFTFKQSFDISILFQIRKYR